MKHLARFLILLSITLSTLAAQDYYVYHLVDPRNGQVFYVGKGSGARVDDHEREAGRLKMAFTEKDLVIRDIWRDGLRVQKRIVRRFACESDAYDFERQEIARIGMHRLTNQRRGSETKQRCKG